MGTVVVRRPDLLEHRVMPKDARFGTEAVSMVDSLVRRSRGALVGVDAFVRSVVVVHVLRFGDALFAGLTNGIDERGRIEARHHTDAVLAHAVEQLRRAFASSNDCL